MEFENLLVNINEPVATVTINRPDRLNTLDAKTLEELKQAFSGLKLNENVAVIILTGNGEKAFCAGADISELNKLNMITAKEFAERGHDVFNFIENCTKPVIAAVNGLALGGGCELSLACHIRIASDKSKFGQPEVNLGIIPGYGGTQRLTRIINSGRAMEYILTGNLMDAEEALRIGLVSKVYPADELYAKVSLLAQKIAAKPRQAVRLAVESVKKADQVSLREGLVYEASLFAICCGTEDFKEGTAAFLEKRAPEFKNK